MFEQIHEFSKIDYFYLHKLVGIIAYEKKL
ncbi:hypothetical protein [Bacillus pumilus]